MRISSKKITTVTRRRHEFFVLRRRFKFNLFCQLCAADSEFVTIDDAVLFSGLTTREIVRQIETSELHFLETVRGHLFVCRASLMEKAAAGFAEIELFEKHKLLIKFGDAEQ